MTESYEDSYRRRMSTFSDELWKRLEVVPTLPGDQAVEVVKYLLQLACQPSNAVPILLGRRSLVRIPRAWLIPRLDDAAVAALDLNDEWEYRRYLEVCSFIDPALAEQVAKRGLTSGNADVRETAAHFSGRCAELAGRDAQFLEQPPL
jgi:hypothetical protein